MAAGLGRGRRPGTPAGETVPAARFRLPGRAVARPARPHAARSDAAAGGPDARVLHARTPARADGRGHRPAARRNPLAARLSERGRPGLPHAGSPVAHTLRWRGPAHQPDHGVGHLAGEHAVRAGRALDRFASARHGARDRGDEAAARRRQLAGGSGARPTDHAGGRPPARHGPGTGRTRRERGVLRHAAAACARAGVAHGRVPDRCAACRRRAPARAAAARASRTRWTAPASTTSRPWTSRSRCTGWCA